MITSRLGVRDAAGRTRYVSSRPELATILCDSPKQTAGQWIVFPADPLGRVFAGIHNGRQLESVSTAMVFSSQLDEAGEEYVAVLCSTGLTLLRIRLTTPKLSIDAHYRYVNHYSKMHGWPEPGADGLSAVDDAAGREAVRDELAYKVLTLAAEVYRLAEGCKADIPRHERGKAGAAGVDALGTLRAWKLNPSWYAAATAGERGSIAVSRGRYILPLRTLQGAAEGGNRFLAAAVAAIGEIVNALPKSAAAAMAAALMTIARRRLSIADTLAPCTPAEARRYLARVRPPTRSALLVEKLHEVSEMARGRRHRPDSAGCTPFSLPSTEEIFQRVAVTEVMISLGLPEPGAHRAFQDAKSAKGAAFNDYIAWSDTPEHGLAGWRDQTDFPSDYRPDLVVKRVSDSARLLIDAKLRAGSSIGGLLSASGVKELQAYMQEYGISRGVLLVPDSTDCGCRCEDVIGSSHMIRAIALPSSNIVASRDRLRECVEEMWNE